METRYVVGVLVAALLLGTFVAEIAIRPAPSGASQEYFEGPEAISWLAGNDSESALASNRFADTAAAAQFVQRLYDAGAEKVIVPQDAIRSDEYETYADALVITLPNDPERRARVLAVCAPEMASQGGSPDEVGAEKQVFLWWD